MNLADQYSYETEEPEYEPEFEEPQQYIPRVENRKRRQQINTVKENPIYDFQAAMQHIERELEETKYKLQETTNYAVELYRENADLKQIIEKSNKYIQQLNVEFEKMKLQTSNLAGWAIHHGALKQGIHIV